MCVTSEVQDTCQGPFFCTLELSGLFGGVDILEIGNLI